MSPGKPGNILLHMAFILQTMFRQRFSFWCRELRISTLERAGKLPEAPHRITAPRGTPHCAVHLHAFPHFTHYSTLYITVYCCTSAPWCSKVSHFTVYFVVITSPQGTLSCVVKFHTLQYSVYSTGYIDYNVTLLSTHLLTSAQITGCTLSWKCTLLHQKPLASVLSDLIDILMRKTCVLCVCNVWYRASRGLSYMSVGIEGDWG